MTRLGIDLGDVRIGVAIGDELGLVASPFRVLKSRGWEHDIKEITAIARDTGAGEIVVGMPRNMDGT
ncbi:MAG: Holliday junction resolvase RuvX, partial [Firmicutes bacterium]|nr:Holliday junction resolvase RuvX [Bacillota bacterium]